MSHLSPTSPTSLIKSTATPALFARTASAGQWKLKKHLQVLSRAVTDTIAGRDGVRRLLVTMPPQHGKSEFCSHWLPSWYLGSFPDKRVILTSYEADFAAKWGRKVRDTINEHGVQCFGVAVSPDSSSAARWEIAGHTGGMIATGVGGAVTGRGADLFLIDDPFKNHEEANSKKTRDYVWDWYRSTAYTRLQPNAAIVVIQTRWHEDDLAGRLQKAEKDGGDKWRVVKLAAYAELDDPLGRQPGEALWPERFSVSELQSKEKTLGSYFWNAMYQQRPIPPGGTIFHRDKFEIVQAAPAEIRNVTRGWDKAGADETNKDGDSSAGVLIGVHQGIWYILDVVHGKWSPLNRDRVMKSTAEIDATRYGTQNVSLWIEKEPGNGGKQSAQISIMDLARFGPRVETPTTDKVLRARMFAAQVEAGNVRLVAGSWNSKYIDELVNFPHGSHDDMVDGTSIAFNHHVLGTASVTTFPTRAARAY